jgi:hypothetical protein
MNKKLDEFLASAFLLLHNIILITRKAKEAKRKKEMM